MKKKSTQFTILLATCFIALNGVHGQMTTEPQPKLRSDYYTVSGGFLGSANFTRFRVYKENPSAIHWKTQVGWSGGVWLNFPIGKVFSIEPQGMYSSYRYKPDGGGAGVFDGNLDYITVPILLKFGIGSKLALFVGPQFDFLMSVDDKNNVNDKEDFEKTSTSLTGGLEIFPHGRVTIFGRYYHGMNNMNNGFTSVDARNQGGAAGLKVRLFGKHVFPDSDGDGILDKDDKCPTQSGTAAYNGCPIPDTDGDGLNDEQDKCPTQAGTAKYNGCPIPDTDGDGINDEEDKCPTQAGTAKYNGCPIPDTDGDGINDEEDKCPSQAGLKEYQGCPIPDSDKDGINDPDDKCPSIPGIRENDGCPAIPEFDAANIQFVTGSSKLTSGAMKELDDIVAYMKQYPEIRLQINGHTDNVGKEQFNQTLSEKRANAVRAALEKKGLDTSRLGAAGYGMTQPIADNSTSQGKAKNRRVEFKFSQ